MVYLIKDFHFKFKSINIFILKNHIFSYAFHCINFSCFFVLGLKYFSKSTFANNSKQCKVIKFSSRQPFFSEFRINATNWTLNSSLDFIIRFIIRVITFFLIDIIFLIKF
jgi:hypothetical protein